MRRIVAGIVVAGFTLSGCSTITAGTPMGDPDQTGISGVPQEKWTRLACFQGDIQAALVGDG
ncbi:uncharacterized protein YceK [Mycolicibacterium lutetiense]|uniref:Uncharacterized protein YceK n=1 Tax=Mycolicibacterium lutetiense TaxID=1641992 RepID=A0ABS4ZY42_9MYCO|nr:uncharacterized protein YceK [Mycolicibacterium lutetiense]